MIGIYYRSNLRREVFGVNVPSENRRREGGRWPRGRQCPKTEIRGRGEMIVCRFSITPGLPASAYCSENPPRRASESSRVLGGGLVLQGGLSTKVLFPQKIASTKDCSRKELPLPTGSVSERSISSQSCCAERSFECRWPNVDGWRSGWVERVGRKL
jgi:hypothetical protein